MSSTDDAVARLMEYIEQSKQPETPVLRPADPDPYAEHRVRASLEQAAIQAEYGAEPEAPQRSVAPGAELPSDAMSDEMLRHRLQAELEAELEASTPSRTNF